MTPTNEPRPFALTLDEIDALQGDLGKSYRIVDLLATFMAMDGVLVTIEDGCHAEDESVDAVNDLMEDIRDALYRARTVIDQCYERAHASPAPAAAKRRNAKGGGK